MDPNVPSDNSWPEEPGTYWRRRVFALAAGLGVLGLLAWACSGALGGASPAGQASVSRASDAAQQGPGSSSVVLPTPTPTPTATATATATITPTASPSQKAHAAASAHATASAHTSSGAHRDGCAAGDIVISLVTSRAVYAHAATPQFTVNVVNTGHRRCTFDAGRQALRLVIKSGHVRVWSSADCAHGAGQGQLHLRRGVPFVTQVSWDRRGSASGCRSDRPGAEPGTYSAIAVSHAGHSKVAVFVLR